MWSVPRIWEGGECWILGGGPSLPRQFDVPEEIIDDVLYKRLPLSAYSDYMTAIHNKHVIGVNMAYRIGDWIDMVFFGDKKWYFDNRHNLAKFKGLKVTCHQFFNKPQFAEENVKYVKKDSHQTGISADPRKAVWNSNSGAAAISVAANMGVKKIILVGFDMKLNEGDRQHWHGEYRSTFDLKDKSRYLPFDKHLVGFREISRNAKELGISIINACPDSVITQFPKVSVKDLL